MPKRLTALLLALVALGACVATAAFASRAATDQEAAAVAAAANSDPQCVTVRISTVDESYAELYSAQNPDCTDADGAAVFHKSGTTWKDIYENSGQEGCPREMPQAVAIDFKICSRPGKRVYIARLGHLVYKPRSLVQGAHGGYERLQWKGWNTATAVGTGVLDYQDAYDTFDLKVRITLTSRGTCGNKRAYQHMKVRVLTGPADVRRSLSTTDNDLGCTGGA
jgi:osmotically-inducible protein OsmY